MLNVKLFNMKSFLPEAYEDALAPQLMQAHEKLQNATGAGSDFTGWVHLPRKYDRIEFDRIKKAAARIQAIMSARTGRRRAVSSVRSNVTSISIVRCFFFIDLPRANLRLQTREQSRLPPLCIQLKRSCASQPPGAS